MYKDSLVHGVLGVEELLVQNCQKQANEKGKNLQETTVYKYLIQRNNAYKHQELVAINSSLWPTG